MTLTVDVLLNKTIYFDGKRDTTLKIKKIVSKSYKSEVNEEHISIVIELGSHQVGRFTPQAGSAKNISTGLINFFQK